MIYLPVKESLQTEYRSSLNIILIKTLTQIISLAEHFLLFEIFLLAHGYEVSSQNNLTFLYAIGTQKSVLFCNFF